MSTQTEQLLAQWSSGQSEALARLLPGLYTQLRGLARAALRSERREHTLETSGLVHEAYLRLLAQHSVHCQSRGQFFAIAATTMRRVLVDHARTRGYRKRWAQLERVPLGEELGSVDPPAVELLAVAEALDRLAAVSPEQTRLVELRVFLGFTIEECAAQLAISVPTAVRRWRAARAWLYRFLSAGRP